MAVLRVLMLSECNISAKTVFILEICVIFHPPKVTLSSVLLEKRRAIPLFAAIYNQQHKECCLIFAIMLNKKREINPAPL